MQTVIRYATEEDLPALLDIYNYAVIHLPATFDLEPQTLEQRVVWFRQFGERYPLLAAECDGTVVGYCGLTSFRAKPAYDRTAELSVYIDERYHGKGIATRLLQAIIDEARQRQFHVIVACITGGNEASVKLHEKFGFEFAGTFKKVGYKFDAWQDVWFYQLTFGSGA
ncbi:GNAT family N-acetyltransferase [Paenibacillus koleovorans]|uniref:GNAT family N-acetyltransferase n=1 Tax=Paenibacillus koleovorans TaxID=121608 RepID=UPI000FDC3967|nr:GNAT family N-acetyltransferase [Paenibacillus koleovorans]